MAHSSSALQPSLAGVQDFLETVKKLRHPTEGCPWDLAQTHRSLEKYFEEEVQEFLEALDTDGPESPKTWEELGDVLLQVALHSELASEKGITNFNEVCQRAAQKLRLRHPHVFDPQFPKFKTAEEVNKAWEKIKAYERTQTGRSASTSVATSPLPSEPSVAQQIASVPKKLSALRRASRMGEKAAAFHFDWPDAASALNKVREELEELQVEENEKNEMKAQEELGDLFFSLAQYARKKNWDPEMIVAQSNEKFAARMKRLEDFVRASGKKWEDCTVHELDELWDQLKHKK